MNRKRLLIAMLPILTFLSAGNWLAVGQVVEHRPWSEMKSLLGEEIGLDLPDQTYVHGKVLTVRDDGLDLRISETSDSKLHPKGKTTTVARASISEIELFRNRNIYNYHSEGASIGATIGTIGGGYLGILIGNRIGGEKGMDKGAWIGMITGGVLGTLAGAQRSAQELTLIYVVPEPSADSPASSIRRDATIKLPVSTLKPARETDRLFVVGDPAPPWPR